MDSLESYLGEFRRILRDSVFFNGQLHGCCFFNIREGDRFLWSLECWVQEGLTPLSKTSKGRYV